MCSCPDYQKTQNKTHHWEPSQTTAMIPTLPEDVLILILEDFALPNHDLDCPRGEERKWKGRPRQCLTTLYNACLVSRALHRISCPILYRGFSDRTLFRRGIVPERLEPAQLLRTICSRPEYGQALRSLSITTWAYANPWDDDEPFGSMQSDTTLLELLQSRAKSCWIGDNDNSPVWTSRSLPDGSLISELLYSIEMDSLEAHIAMLLLLCPKLKTLELRTPSHFEDSMVARLLDATLSRGYQTAKLPQPIRFRTLGVRSSHFAGVRCSSADPCTAEVRHASRSCQLHYTRSRRASIWSQILQEPHIATVTSTCCSRRRTRRLWRCNTRPYG